RGIRKYNAQSQVKLVYFK
ncbi:hypothetical protein, partial [Escherichia coli]